ncbi:alpha/beta hydrolase [Pseudoruegeria sp. SK021]|nr:alpha/beta hydrolase [Pseudoruegeria sp. SK021]OSP54539.1 alpha/beta hydrolase [Pseudoruegeria sp. SK021]
MAQDRHRAAPPKTFTTSDGLRLAYRDEGGGPVLLCLSGLTRNMSDFDFIARDYSDRARVIRMDYRGRGASDFDPDYLHYTLEREGRDALELLDHLGIDRAAILGTSRGGLIAMTLATSHKDRLSGVCLVDIGPELNPKGLVDIFGYLGLTPSETTLEYGTDALVARSASDFPHVSRARWRQHAERIWRETDAGLELRYDPQLRDALLAQSQTSSDEVANDMWPAFDTMNGLPLALLHGQYSNLLTDTTVDKMRERRADMIYEQVANRGHVPFLDEPESRRGIAAFLELIV